MGFGRVPTSTKKARRKGTEEKDETIVGDHWMTIKWSIEDSK